MGDDRYHIFPTVVPELYELTPGFKKNGDCIVDLTLTKFLFNAFRQACEVFGSEAAKKRSCWTRFGMFWRISRIIRPRNRQRGKVFVSVAGRRSGGRL